VDIDAAWLAILLDEFPGATVDELRLRDPFARPVLQDAYPDAAVLPLGFETPDAPPVPSEPRSEPLPPRRHRPGKGAAAPDDPEPEVVAAGSCRFCREPVDLRESGGDPDGGWSHLACWAEAGHPDVGWAAKLRDTPFGPTLPPDPQPRPPGTPWRPRP
jgi:hypothetical protein